MIIERIKALLTPKVSTDAKVSGISLFLGKTLDQFSGRIESLESRQLQKGDDGGLGEQGERGPIGPKGLDGKSGLDGKTITGPKGDKGDLGTVGKAGKQGVSIVDAEIAVDDHLVLKLSDGKIIDAGELPKGRSGSGQVVVSGNAWQITVSSTAPPNPQIDQLWYDIS